MKAPRTERGPALTEDAVRVCVTHIQGFEAIVVLWLLLRDFPHLLTQRKKDILMIYLTLKGLSPSLIVSHRQKGKAAIDVR